MQGIASSVAAAWFKRSGSVLAIGIAIWVPFRLEKRSRSQLEAERQAGARIVQASLLPNLSRPRTATAEFSEQESGQPSFLGVDREAGSFGSDLFRMGPEFVDVLAVAPDSGASRATWSNSQSLCSRPTSFSRRPPGSKETDVLSAGFRRPDVRRAFLRETAQKMLAPFIVGIVLWIPTLLLLSLARGPLMNGWEALAGIAPVLALLIPGLSSRSAGGAGTALVAWSIALAPVLAAAGMIAQFLVSVAISGKIENEFHNRLSCALSIACCIAVGLLIHGSLQRIQRVSKAPAIDGDDDPRS